MDQLEQGKPRRPVWRLRDRIFIVLTANVAWLGAWQAYEVSQEYVLDASSARRYLMLASPSFRDILLFPSLFLRPESQPTSRPASRSAAHDELSPREILDAYNELDRQDAAIQVIVTVWRRIIWGVAGFVGLTALLAAVTQMSRLFHLLAAGVILLSTMVTLVGMSFLIDPDYGGMEPLAWRWYFCVAAIQSAYGFMLLLAFARNPKAKPAHA